VGVDPLTERVPAVFFDRDGVLVDAVIRHGRPFPTDEQTVRLAADARDAVARLAEHFAYLFVVSNQPDVARGTRRREDVERFDAQLGALLPLTAIYTCMHDDVDGCACRKPLPGLLEQAARAYDVDLHASYLIGDRWRDVDAGASAGCTTVLIDRGYAERAPSHRPDAVVADLTSAADTILALEAARRHRESVHQ
jgi:D-glycero-D-manno-heptose 1,7-bisphosphate phosphatase